MVELKLDPMWRLKIFRQFDLIALRNGRQRNFADGRFGVGFQGVVDLVEGIFSVPYLDRLRRAAAVALALALLPLIVALALINMLLATGALCRRMLTLIPRR